MFTSALPREGRSTQWLVPSPKSLTRFRFAPARRLRCRATASTLKGRVESGVEGPEAVEGALQDVGRGHFVHDLAAAGA